MPTYDGLPEQQIEFAAFSHGTLSLDTWLAFATWWNTRFRPMAHSYEYLATVELDEQDHPYLVARIPAESGMVMVGVCYTLQAFFQLLTSAFADARLAELGLPSGRSIDLSAAQLDDGDR